ERGLCGGYNSQIARVAREQVRKLLAEGTTVKIFTVGKTGHDILRREFASVIFCVALTEAITAAASGVQSSVHHGSA
ncbi:hypothetical protein AB9E03_34550, partial [Rhizobium leguminosarum]